MAGTSQQSVGLQDQDLEPLMQQQVLSTVLSIRPITPFNDCSWMEASSIWGDNSHRQMAVPIIREPVFVHENSELTHKIKI